MRSFLKLVFFIFLGFTFANEIPLITLNGNQQNPQTVFIPELRLYFVVWEDWRDVTDADVYGAFFDENGNICGTEILIAGGNADTENQTEPAVAYARDLKRLLVVWQDTRGSATGGYIYYRNIDLTGVNVPVDCNNINAQITLGTETQVGFNTVVSATEGLNSRYKPKVAYNLSAQQFVIVWIEKRTDNKLVTDTCFNGTTFTYALGDNTMVGYLILNANTLAVVEGPDVFRNTTAHARLVQETQGGLIWTFEYEFFDRVDNVDVACVETANSCLIVFEGDRNKGTVTCECVDQPGGTTEVCDAGEPVYVSLTVENFTGDDDLSHIFATTLERFKLSADLLVKVDTSTENSTNPAVESDPVTERYLVVWEDRRDNPLKTDIYGQILTSTGNLYGNNFIVSFEDLNGDGQNDLVITETSQSFPDTVYDHINQLFLVIWQDDRNNTSANLNMNIYGQFVNSEGSLKGNNINLANAIENQLTPSATYNPYTGDILITWKDARNLSTTQSDIYGVIVKPQVQDASQFLRLLSQDGQTILFPYVLDFGGVALNSNFVLTFYIKNISNSNVPIDCITLTGSGFSISSPLPSQLIACNDNSFYELLPGESLKIDVSFLPTQEIFYEGYINIQNAQTGLNITVKLKGRGIANPLPGIEIIEGDGTNDGTLDFGQVKTGTTARAFVIVRNVGNVTLTIQAITSSLEFYIPEPIIPPPFIFTLTPGSQALVPINFDATSLYAGTYTATLSITTTDAHAVYKTINLKAEVISPVNIQVVSEGDGTLDGTLDFGTVVIGEKKSLTVVIQNTGTAPTTVTINSTDSRFVITVPLGIVKTLDLGPGEYGTIIIEFDSTNLPAGTYTGVLEIVPSNTNTIIKLNMQAKVEEPVIQIIEGDSNKNDKKLILSFGPSGDVATQTFEIVNNGNVPISIYISTSDRRLSVYSEGNLLNPSDSISINPGETKQFTAYFDASGLPNGTYNATIKISTNTGLTFSLTAEVIVKSSIQVIEGDGNNDRVLNIGSLSPGEVAFQLFEIQNTGNVALILYILSTNDKFVLSENQITLRPGESRPITVSFDSSGLNAGTYQTTVKISADRPGVNYEFTVSAQVNVVTDFTITEKDGNPGDNILTLGTVASGDTAIGTFEITNTGNIALDITIASTDNRLTVSSASFTLIPGESRLITVTFDTTGLPANTYTSKLIISSNARVSKEISVEVNVISALDIVQNDTNPSDDTVDFGNVKVGTTASQIIEIRNNGNVSLIVYASTTDSIFTVSEDTFTLAPGENKPLIITFNASGLTEGTYTAILQITASDGNNRNLSRALNLSAVVKSPVLRIDISELDFGNVQAGTTKELSVQIINEGDVVMSVDSCGTPKTAFSVKQCPQSVDPKSSAQIIYVFTPQKPGNYSETITIITDGGTKDITLKGVGTGGWVEVTPQIIDFGYIPVGSTKKLNFTVKNTGTEKITLTGIDTNNLPAPFTVTPVVNFPIDLGPSQDVSFTVEFSPSISGSFVGTIQIQTDALNGNQTVYIQGIAATVDITISTTSIDFGSIPERTTQTSRVVITNNGNVPVSIVSIVEPSPPFSVDYNFTLPYELGAGESVTINVRFSPETPGSFTSSLGIQFDYSQTPEVITLSGTAIPADTGQEAIRTLNLRFFVNGVETQTLNFGEVLVGSAKNITLEIRNETAEQIEVTEITSTGPFYVYESSLRIAPNSSVAMDVYFRPSYASSFLGKLTLKDSKGITYELNLIGNGVNLIIASSEGRASARQEVPILPPGANITPVIAFSYEVRDFTGDSVQIRVTFATPIPANAKVYKLIGSNLKEIYPNNQCNGIDNVSLFSTELSFTIRDNTECDLNPEQGKILDPIVVAYQQNTGTETVPITGETQVPSVTTGGGSAGCSTAPVKDVGMLLYIFIPIIIAVRRMFRKFI